MCLRQSSKHQVTLNRSQVPSPTRSDLSLCSNAYNLLPHCQCPRSSPAASLCKQKDEQYIYQKECLSPLFGLLQLRLWEDTEHHPDLSCRFSDHPCTLRGQSPSMRHWSQMPTFPSVIAEGITFLFPLAHNCSPCKLST